MMFKMGLFLILTGLSLLAGTLQPGSAQEEFPTKSIEISAPYSPGSAGDMTPRFVAEIAKKYSAQPLVVMNKPGAGGIVAAADVMSSKPDGYKLAFLYDMFFITTSKTAKLPFDPNDLVPLANFSQTKMLLIVSGASPWKTLNDLLDYGKKNPGKIRWATVGRGISTHLDGLSLFRKAGVETVFISYKGTPEMLSALLGGHIDVGFMGHSICKDQMRAGAIRGLAALNNKRFSDVLDVPTTLELGFPESSMLPILGGLYLRKDTPEKTKRYLVDLFGKVNQDPEFRKALEKFGEEFVPGDPAFVLDAIKKGERVAIPILKELGLFVDK